MRRCIELLDFLLTCTRGLLFWLLIIAFLIEFFFGILTGDGSAILTSFVIFFVAGLFAEKKEST